MLLLSRSLSQVGVLCVFEETKDSAVCLSFGILPDKERAEEKHAALTQLARGSGRFRRPTAAAVYPPREVSAVAVDLVAVGLVAPHVLFIWLIFSK